MENSHHTCRTARLQALRRETGTVLHRCKETREKKGEEERKKGTITETTEINCGNTKNTTLGWAALSERTLGNKNNLHRNGITARQNVRKTVLRQRLFGRTG